MSAINIIPFTFEGQRVRSIRMVEETVFVATDVAKILGYSSAKDMTQNLDKDEKGGHSVPTPGGIQALQTITKAVRHFQTIDRGMTRDMVFGLLRGAGYLEQAGNAPTVKAIRPGYLKQKVAKRRDGRMGRPYAVFTPKGINWFIRRFIDAEGQGQFDMEVAA